MKQRPKSSKKSKLIKQKVQEEQYTYEISKFGWGIIFLSLITLFIGFFLLKFTNPEGNNFASIISPILIIFSYIFISLGIIVR